MICGYLYNEVGYTWAGAMLRLDAVAGPTGGAGPGPGGGSGGRPVSVRRPWVTHTGRRLVCHKGAWASARSLDAYNWYVDGSLRRETSSRPVAPVPAYLGHRFELQGDAHGPGGSTSAMSPTIRLR